MSTQEQFIKLEYADGVAVSVKEEIVDTEQQMVAVKIEKIPITFHPEYIKSECPAVSVKEEVVETEQLGAEWGPQYGIDIEEADVKGECTQVSSAGAGHSHTGHTELKHIAVVSSNSRPLQNNDHNPQETHSNREYLGTVEQGPSTSSINEFQLQTKHHKETVDYILDETVDYILDETVDYILDETTGCKSTVTEDLDNYFDAEKVLFSPVSNLQSSVSGTSRRIRRRQAAPEEWKKNKIAVLRCAGKEYVSQKNIVRPAVKMGPPCVSCRKNCILKISEILRKNIFTEFWNLENWNVRRQFVVNRVKQSSCQRSRPRNSSQEGRRATSNVYTFEIDDGNIAVCKPFFLSTLGIKDGFVVTALKKKKKPLEI